MRKVLYVSGALTVIMLALFLSGWAAADESLKEAVSKGNRQHTADDYSKALQEYEAGLAVAADSKELNYNAAQTAYLLGEYEKAAEYYEKSEDTIDKFLNYGNIYFKAGDAAEEAEQKVQLYGQALQIYEAGIIKYPQEVPLKYNYELVREKLAQLSQESDEKQQGEDGEQQEGEQEQQGSESENQDGESQEQDGESQQQDGESQEQDSESQQQDSEGEQENSESQQQESENQQQENDSEEQQEGQSQQQEGANQSDEEAASDEEAIQRILQMLESQEEQSLKNNQEVVGGKEGKNGW